MASTQDDAFREIQLSGKQLVFVAMAGLVIAVVIFLFGVQVGRGVLAQRGLPEAADAVSSPEPPLASAPVSQPSSGAPVTAGEKLSYAERLASPQPAAEQLKKQGDPAPAPVVTAPAPKPDSPAPVAPARAAGTSPAPAKASTPAPTAAASSPAPAAAAPTRMPAAAAAPAVAASPEPSGTGFSIQVAALAKRDEADVIAKRLAGKGYPAYVMAPAQGTPNMYRVRVGKYKERREADTVAARLQKEEQFKPWVVR